MSSHFKKANSYGRQGEKLDFYPIVITGIVQAEMPRDSGPMIVERFMPGESFAEAIPKGMGICPVNIVASQDVRLVAIPAANVRSEESPLFERLSKNITGEMSKKVGRLTAKLSMLSETRIRPRLMKYVKTLPSRKDGSYILPETRRDMAAEMGVHEKALLRELRLLPRRGHYRARRAQARSAARRRDMLVDTRGTSMDTTKTMRELCADEPKLESFLQSKGFPFTIDNPITELVTFDDVVQFRGLDKRAFLAEFEAYKTA